MVYRKVAAQIHSRVKYKLATQAIARQNLHLSRIAERPQLCLIKRKLECTWGATVRGQSTFAKRRHIQAKSINIFFACGEAQSLLTDFTRTLIRAWDQELYTNANKPQTEPMRSQHRDAAEAYKCTNNAADKRDKRNQILVASFQGSPDVLYDDVTPECLKRQICSDGFRIRKGPDPGFARPETLACSARSRFLFGTACANAARFSIYQYSCVCTVIAHQINMSKCCDLQPVRELVLPVLTARTELKHVTYQRIGKYSENKRRPFLLRFNTFSKKHLLLKSAKALRQNGLRCDDYLTRLQQQENKHLPEDFQALQAKGYKPFFKGSILMYSWAGDTYICGLGQASNLPAADASWRPMSFAKCYVVVVDRMLTWMWRMKSMQLALIWCEQTHFARRDVDEGFATFSWSLMLFVILPKSMKPYVWLSWQTQAYIDIVCMTPCWVPKAVKIELQ